MNFFTADWHLFHENIISYCSRPFKDTREMHGELIRRHNRLVGDYDNVYVLGDATLLGPDRLFKIRPIVRKMRGRKHLVLGNHDSGRAMAYLDLGFESVHTSLELDDHVFGYGLVLAHDPAWAVMKRHRRWLVGHAHTLFRTLEDGRVVNVGVDVWDFNPVSSEDLSAAIGEWRPTDW